MLWSTPFITSTVVLTLPPPPTDRKKASGVDSWTFPFFARLWRNWLESTDYVTTWYLNVTHSDCALTKATVIFCNVLHILVNQRTIFFLLLNGRVSRVKLQNCCFSVIYVPFFLRLGLTYTYLWTFSLLSLLDHKLLQKWRSNSISRNQTVVNKSLKNGTCTNTLYFHVDITIRCRRKY